MNERPWSVAVIGWLLIVAGAAALAAVWTGVPGALETARAFAAAFEGEAMLYASLAVAVGCGAGILAGINWARLIYVGWNLAGIADGLLLISPMRFSAPAAGCAGRAEHGASLRSLAVSRSVRFRPGPRRPRRPGRRRSG